MENPFLESKVSKQRPSHLCVATISPKISSPNSVLTHHLTKKAPGPQKPQSLCITSGVPDPGNAHLTVRFCGSRTFFARKKARYCKTATCNRFVPNSLILHDSPEKTSPPRLINLSGQSLITVTSDELSSWRRTSLEYPSRSLSCSLRRVFWSHLTA